MMSAISQAGIPIACSQAIDSFIEVFWIPDAALAEQPARARCRSCEAARTHSEAREQTCDFLEAAELGTADAACAAPASKSPGSSRDAAHRPSCKSANCASRDHAPAPSHLSEDQTHSSSNLPPNRRAALRGAGGSGSARIMGAGAGSSSSSSSSSSSKSASSPGSPLPKRFSTLPATVEAIVVPACRPRGEPKKLIAAGIKVFAIPSRSGKMKTTEDAGSAGARPGSFAIRGGRLGIGFIRSRPS